jgi:transposase
MTDEILREMSPLFDGMYAQRGRPSIPPEKLLRGQLLQMLYSVRWERLLMEEIDYSMLLRWFVGLNLDEEVWEATTFTKHRDRLLEAEVAQEFLTKVVERARSAGLPSDEHFTVDGTLLEAWASLKSFQPKDQNSTLPPDDPGNPTVNFHGTRRSNQTHAWKTDPDAQLARKGPGKEAKLSYSGNLLVENRNGLIVNAELLEANGRAERDAALLMLEQIPGVRRVTAGADKGYDTAEFVAECRHLGVTPHVARNTGRRGGSALDARTTRHPGYAVSQRKRKRIEECFAWLKDERTAPQAATPRTAESGLDLHLRGSGLQPGRHAQSAPAVTADRPKGLPRVCGRLIRSYGQKTQSTEIPEIPAAEQKVTRQLTFSAAC